jgi:hypothetical protein
LWRADAADSLDPMTRQKMNRITALMLLLGFGGALGIYLTAKPAPDDPLREDPLSNKKYLNEMKRIGGEANVVAAEFNDWFAAQWQGVQLARTVALLTVGAVLVFRFAATPPEADEPPRPTNPPPPGPAG